MSYLEKLIGVFIKPKSTLIELKKEEGISNSFKFVLFSSIISSIIFLVFDLISGEAVLTSITSSALVLLILIAYIFIISGVFHLLIKLFGGLKPYYQTFKVFAYLSAFWLLGALVQGISKLGPQINFVSIIVGFWVFVLLLSFLQHYSEISQWKIWLICLIVIGLIYFIYLGIVAYLFTSVIAPFSS